MKEEVKRKTQIPKCPLYLASQGNALCEKKNIEECNFRECAAIDKTLRLQGGTNDEEPKPSARSTEERQARRRTSELKT